MRRPSLTRFKVCCIQSVEEAWMAVDAGASALGLVSRMPSGPGAIEDERIAEIAARVPPGVDTFLLTSLREPEAIIEQHRAARTTALQLVDRVSPGVHTHLRSALPGIRLVQVVHVVDGRAIAEAEEAAMFVDGILLDSGNADLEVKELGGTGRRHDWAVSARIRERIGVPVYLAGGLRPDNAADAIATVGPFALDVCTGLRGEGFELDPMALSRFAERVRGELSGSVRFAVSDDELIEPIDTDWDAVSH